MTHGMLRAPKVLICAKSVAASTWLLPARSDAPNVEPRSAERHRAGTRPLRSLGAARLEAAPHARKRGTSRSQSEHTPGIERTPIVH